MEDMERCLLLAEDRGCKDPSYMEGFICTNRCPFRHECNINRIPLLIQAEASDFIFEHDHQHIRGIVCSLDILTKQTPDEYIIGGQKRKL